MGWAHAPSVAQAAAEALAGEEEVEKGIVFVYIDDFLWTARSREELEEQLRNFRARAKEAGVAFAEEKCTWDPQRTVVFLGCRWDLQEGRYELLPEWREKACEVIVAVARAGRAPLRVVWGALGRVAWAAHVLRVRLARFPEIIAFMATSARQVCEGRLAWGSRVDVPRVVSAELEAFAGEFLEARVRRGPPEDIIEEADAVIFTDASLRGHGAVLSFGSEAWGRWGTWGEDDDRNIFQKEMEATRRGVEAAAEKLPRGARVLVVGDNLSAVRALRKGHSATREGNTHVRDFDEAVRKTGAVRVEWISTRHMPADRWSRMDGGAPGAGESGRWTRTDDVLPEEVKRTSRGFAWSGKKEEEEEEEEEEEGGRSG